MRKKLKAQKGETLIEAMVSLLIALLAVMFLTTAVLTAANINKATREADEKFAEELKYAEGRIKEAGREIEQKELLIDFESLDDVRVDVEVYGGIEGLFISYDEMEVSEP